MKVRTHTIKDTSGICVCLGNMNMGGGEAGRVREEVIECLKRMGAKWSEKIEIDTTHFVCETPASASSAGGGGRGGGAPGVEYQRALQLSIPVVTPGWVFACHREKK